MACIWNTPMRIQSMQILKVCWHIATFAPFVSSSYIEKTTYHFPCVYAYVVIEPDGTYVKSPSVSLQRLCYTFFKAFTCRFLPYMSFESSNSRLNFLLNGWYINHYADRDRFWFRFILYIIFSSYLFFTFM